MPHAALYGVGPERAFFNVIHEFDVDANAAPGQLTFDGLPAPAPLPTGIGGDPSLPRLVKAPI